MKGCTGALSVLLALFAVSVVTAVERPPTLSALVWEYGSIEHGVAVNVHELREVESASLAKTLALQMVPRHDGLHQARDVVPVARPELGERSHRAKLMLVLKVAGSTHSMGTLTANLGTVRADYDNAQSSHAVPYVLARFLKTPGAVADRLAKPVGEHCRSIVVCDGQDCRSDSAVEMTRAEFAKVRSRIPTSECTIVVFGVDDDPCEDAVVQDLYDWAKRVEDRVHVLIGPEHELDSFAPLPHAGRRLATAGVVTEFVRMTPDIATGLIIGLIFIALTLFALQCLFSIGSPTRFSNKSLPQGKEF